MNMASAFATAQASIGTSSALLVAGRTLRRQVVIRNTHASNTLYVGPTSGVTTANGHSIAAGGSLTLDTDAAIYAIASAVSTTVTVLETFEP